MSYLSASPDVLVASLWPETLSAAITQPRTQHNISNSHIVPSTLESLIEHIDLADDPEITNPFRRKCIVYKPLVAPDQECLWAMTLRIHGFVEYTQITTFGSWNGTPHTAHTAVQRVVLGGGTCRTAWKAQQTSLALLADFVSRSLRLPLATPFVGSKLHMQRYVFRKSDKVTSQTCPNIADPNNWLSSLNQKWSLQPPLPIYDLKEDGSTSRISDLLLQQGDFVEIEVGFDIVINKKITGGRAVHVFLSLEHITRLSKVKMYKHHASDGTSKVPNTGNVKRGNETCIDGVSRNIKRRRDNIHHDDHQLIGTGDELVDGMVTPLQTSV